nr:MAG TPA: hypothetical protein [Caudoviricetes sp.]
MLQEVGTVEEPLLLKIVHQSPKLKGLGKTPLNHRIGVHIPRIYSKIGHIKHPLPGLVASPQLYRPGEGNGRRAAWQTYRNYRPRSARCW